ncbi:polysaccharide biosynthesis tyrosine autokinase [Mycobacterium sp. NBC_00419]|uniref:polysaccharide biosynthesis tyrosine autokinase n=1 Tax=Mycobacterium sp. NBC_00419 TaxID=2975989 RepID=UPI002E20C9E7
MNLQEFIKVLRARWITVAAALTAALLAAATVTLLTTPLYQASTRLFVSTSAGQSLSDAYQGTLFSQERVLSYTQLLKGETLAKRTIDKLGLDMKPSALTKRITASAKQDTVLIDLQVLDASPLRARDIANALSDEFVKMVKELETPPDGRKPDARVIVEQRATIPESPVVPKTSRNIALGLVAGVLLGVGLAILRDRLDNSVKDRETLEDITGVGLVGNIPADKERRKDAAIAFDKESSGISEAFRKLRTNLQFLAVDNPPRVILVASSLPNEGKSTTAINLALVLAEAGHTVVLVDGDMRKPMLDKYLNLVGTAGFSTVLSGAAEIDDVLQKTEFPGLTVLASGAIPPNPSELLASQTAKRILGELREKFDYVIVDSSPLVAVTDAAVLSASVDGVLMMVRFGSTKREQLAHAIRNLSGVGASILGAVFTMTAARGTTAYSYSYNYSYGSDGATLNGSSDKNGSAETPADVSATPEKEAAESKP